MKNKKTIKNILIILVVAVVLLIVYSLFTANGSQQKNSGGLSSLIGSSTTGQIQETDVTLANAEILKILGSIENIELQDDIFSNPIFKQLQDTQFSIPKPVRVGRTNPFLPIGYESLLSSSGFSQNNPDDINSYNEYNQNKENEANSFFDENNQFNEVNNTDLENLDALNSGE